MRDLKATKPLTYNTRRLLPGDTFTALSDRDAKTLVTLGKATRVSATSSPDAAEDIKALRAEYTALTGKKPFGGWSADDLRQKIATAKTET